MTAFSPSKPDESSKGREQPTRTGGRRRKLWIAALAVLLALSLIVAPFLFYLRGSGIKTSVLNNVVPGYAKLEHPFVTTARPNPSEGVISCNSFIAVDVMLPNAGYVVDAATVNSGSVRLIRKLDSWIVPARVNTSAAGDALVLQPEQALSPNTYYRFEILPALKDTAGASFKPFRTGFTTGGAGEASTMPVAFEKIELPLTAGRMYTAVAVGPDGDLYAATYTGDLLRCSLHSDGTIASVDVIETVHRANGGDRLITGICFDPDSTPGAPVLYVSHGQSTRTAADDWTGKLSRLTGATLDHYQDVLVGFPRAARDHLNNQPAFGPDGALYLPNGSNSAMGDADATWGNRPERKLSACVMRIDLAAIGQRTIDIRTDDGGGPYNPFAPGAPVTVYASGVRNAYDLVWTRDGKLMAPINGSAAGGNTPESPKRDIPALHNVRLTIPDHLARIEPGRYYGHPNPSRGEYVLMGGNPTDGIDPIEVNRYPVGILPQSRWKPPVAEFGSNISPCGIIEYKGSGRTLPIDGALMVCRYSGGKDVCLFLPGRDGSFGEMVTGIDGLFGFADPLDLVQHPVNGHLYVAEFGGKRVTLLRAKPQGVSSRVYREKVGLGMGLHETPAGKHIAKPEGDDARED
ncbi:PQQ-dependent sugar dehydrogenase [Humisphaera borealis]|uniref:PQQ-dependent sugar dehydrogenase n=1 Tax=Humisphaera borealis TaxID=2807512 RepID=A0A7M2WT60_9BACT|nr:PQQ-dependent sugar dehydrogenase [Humisphaera borealis]QOV88697.1 PQQ-dependent sugar dehydrogenase [Humisphaera borealis]